MNLLAAWNILMYRYSGQSEILIGTPISGRAHQELENQIGCFVNTLVLRNHVDGDESFAAFYDRLRENTLSCYAHQSYPFDRLVEELDIFGDKNFSFGWLALEAVLIPKL